MNKVNRRFSGEQFFIAVFLVFPLNKVIVDLSFHHES